MAEYEQPKNEANCHPDRPRYHGTKCQKCYDKDRYPREAEQRKARASRWKKANPERHGKLQRDGQRRRLYGLTPEAYDAMLAGQQGLCAICHQPEATKGRGGAIKPLAVDHDHSTGEVRGLLCEHCNQGLGRFMDSPALLSAAALYLGAVS